MTKALAIIAVATALGAVSAYAQSTPNPNCAAGMHYDTVSHVCVQNTTGK